MINCLPTNIICDCCLSKDIIVHFQFAFGPRRRDTGSVLDYLFLTVEKVAADGISVCVVDIRTSLLIGQVLVTQLCLTLWPHGLSPARLLCPWGFSRQEYWSGLPCPPPGDRPHPGIEPGLPHCRRFFTAQATREASNFYKNVFCLPIKVICDCCLSKDLSARERPECKRVPPVGTSETLE